MREKQVTVHFKFLLWCLYHRYKHQRWHSRAFHKLLLHTTYPLLDSRNRHYRRQLCHRQELNHHLWCPSMRSQSKVSRLDSNLMAH